MPVDGGYTLETFDMMEVLRAINAPLMIPMHVFGPSTLNRFLASAREHFPVEFSATATITLSRTTLPNSPRSSCRQATEGVADPSIWAI